MQAPEGQKSRGRHLVIAVHGIRTFGDWQERLGALLRSADPSIMVRQYKYGYFSALAFVFPPARLVETRRLRAYFERLAREEKWDRIDIVAHSFGSHIVGYALLEMDARQRPEIHTILLAGSVLKSTFPWDHLIGSGVGRVVNECGTRDSILLLSHFAAIIPPFTGMAGRIGFYGLTGEQMVNRFYRFGHSDYFLAGGNPDDCFMRENWVPLLTDDKLVRPVDERGRLDALHGFWMFIANNAGPFKLSVLAALLVAPWLYYKSLYEDATLRLVDSLIAQGDTQVSIRNPARAQQLYAEARKKLKDLGRETVPADLGLYHAYRALPRPLQVLDGGREGITHFSVAPDSRTAITYSRRGLLKWDLLTGLESQRIAACEGRVSAVVLAGKGGDVVVVGTHTGEVVACDAASATRIWSHAGATAVSAIAVSADGERAAVGDKSGLIRILEARSGETRNLRGHQTEIANLALSPDGRRLLSTAADRRVLLWSIESRGAPRLIRDRSARRVSMAFAAGGRVALVAGPNQIEAWDAGSGKLLGSHAYASGSNPESEDDRPVLSGDGRILLASLRQGLMVGVREQDQFEELQVLAVHLEERQRDRIAIRTERRWTLPRYAVRTRGAAFPDAAQTIVLLTVDNHIEVRDLSDAPEPRNLGFGGAFQKPGVSGDGLLVLAPQRDGTAEIRDAATASKLRTLSSPGDPVASVALSADGGFAATGMNGGDIKIWDTRSGAKPATIPAHRGRVVLVAFAPDREHLLSLGEDGSAYTWSLSSGTRQHRLSDGQPHATDASYSSDSRLIAVGATDGTIMIWDARTGQRLRMIPAHAGPAYSVAFSAGEPRLVSAGHDQLIRTWDVSSGKRKGEATSASFRSHAAFLSDSRWAVSAGTDRAVKLWDLSTGTLLYEFPALYEGHAAITVARHGTRVITSGAYWQNLLWNLDAGVKQLELAASLRSAHLALRVNARDPAALATLGRWYAFRARCEWAAQLFEAAGAEGAPEASWLDRLGCFALTGRQELAQVELRRVAERRAAPAAYVDLWQQALDAGLQKQER